MIGRSINDLYTRCTTCLIIYRHNIYRHLFVPLYYTAILEMKRITKYYPGGIFGPQICGLGPNPPGLRGGRRFLRRNAKPARRIPVGKAISKTSNKASNSANGRPFSQFPL
eukprot:COSAG01_NODE_4479_length_4986_cov_2.568242_2_plen_111_part_00